MTRDLVVLVTTTGNEPARKNTNSRMHARRVHCRPGKDGSERTDDATMRHFYLDGHVGVLTCSWAESGDQTFHGLDMLWRQYS